MLRKGRTFVATATLLVALTQRAFPTTVVPLSFDQLVQQAEVVSVGEVIDRDVLFVSPERSKNACGAGAGSNEIVLVVS